VQFEDALPPEREMRNFGLQLGVSGGGLAPSWQRVGFEKPIVRFQTKVFES
jgi:hypothetical protein